LRHEPAIEPRAAADFCNHQFLAIGFSFHSGSQVISNCCFPYSLGLFARYISGTKIARPRRKHE
jgi:hypothetical protein